MASPVAATPPTTHDVSCPLCEYDLRGAVDPRCPECGYSFEWEDLTDPARRLHRYLFEHHPERPIWSYWKTVTGGWLPRRFWRTLKPVQPSHPRRLVKYWAIGACIACACLAVQLVPGILDIQERLAKQHTWNAARLNGLDPSTQKGMIRPYKTVQAYLDARWPTEFNLRLFVLAYKSHEPGVFMSLLACYLAWPWLTLLALLIFRWSMRRAGVRIHHVLRCSIYSLDLGVWIGLIVLAATAAALLLAGSANLTRGGMQGLLMSSWLFALLGFYRLWMSYRLYMRFNHAFATILSSQIIVALSMLSIAAWLAAQ